VEDVITHVVGYRASKDDGGMYLVTSKNEGRLAAQWVSYSKVQNITDLFVAIKDEKHPRSLHKHSSFES